MESVKFQSQAPFYGLHATTCPSRHLKNYVEGLWSTQGLRSLNRTEPGGVSQTPDGVTAQTPAIRRARAGAICVTSLEKSVLGQGWITGVQVILA